MTEDLELKAYTKRCNALRKRIDKANSELQTLTKVLKDNCTHPEEYRIVKSDSFEGSYYDRSFTDRWIHCTRCNQRISEINTTYGYYG